MQFNGNIHKTINHSLRFVDPNDPNIHTQTIESIWKSLKSHIPKQTNGNMKELYIEEYVFRKMHKWNEKTPGERMGLMIEKIVQLYPGAFI